MTAGRMLMDAREVPTDPDLPGLSAVLDPQMMQKVIARERRDPEVEITGCRIEYLRYKPETNCIVSYALDWRDRSSQETGTAHFYAKAFRPDDFAHASVKADLGRRLEVPRFPAVMSEAGLCTVLYFYPNDAGLDGLRLIAEPKKVQRILYERVPYLPQSEWRISDRRLQLTLVRYKPEKRAVLRIDTRATHRTSGERRPVSIYLRTYVDGRGEQVQAIMESLHRQLHGQDGVTTPPPRGYLPDRKTLLMDAVAGTPLTDCLSGDRRHPALQSAARALTRLHDVRGVDAPARSTESLLEEAESTGRFLARLVPDVRTTLDRALKRLHESTAGLAACARAGFVHGDFYHGQVLIDHRQTALLDFDRSYLGDVTADLGNFGAHMHLMERQGRITDGAGAFDDFMSAYQDAAGFRLDPAHVRFWQTHGLLQLAVRPFRTLESDWTETIRATAADCLRTIS